MTLLPTPARSTVPKAATRRAFLARIGASAASLSVVGTFQPAFGADVSWLSEVQSPPKTIPRNDVGWLQPLLIDEAGEPIRNLDGWRRRRQALRRRWLDFLGPMPEERPAVDLKILKQDQSDGCLRQLVQYDSEPGVPVEGYLLKPEKPLAREKTPALLALHQTTRRTIEEIAGLAGPKSQQIGLKLCRRGFVVFCPRNFLWQGVRGYQEAVKRFRRRHPKTLGMHKMLYDAMRGVDVLETVAGVDKNRIGAVGHSLGAKETLYVAAFDERIKAAVASEGGVGFRSTNWDAPWYLGPSIHKPDFKLNHHQLLALIAPRPFLIVAGETGRGAADGRRSWPYVEAALPVWKLYGEPARIGIYNHGEGHTISPKTYRRIEEWLVTYLAPS